MGFDYYAVDDGGDQVEGGCHDTHYWRRNIFGAGPQAQRLVDAGMAYWPREGLAVPGEWPPEGGEWDDEHEAAMMAFLKATYDERPGIAAYKLGGTNDGFWVTAAECQSALKLWEMNGYPEVDDYGDTIPFLQTAAKHAGFRVW